ncbi:hypothetical protein Tco_0352023 [Tanacetum coccineum]
MMKTEITRNDIYDVEMVRVGVKVEKDGGTKKYRGSNSSDGGNTRDGVKIANGVIRACGGIEGKAHSSSTSDGVGWVGEDMTVQQPSGNNISTDKAKITRKQSKTGQTRRQKRKSTQKARNSKAKGQKSCLPPTHPTPSNVDEECAFPSTNILDYTSTLPDYILASSGNTSPNFSNDLTKDLLASLALSPFYDDPYTKVMQAYDATDNELPIPPQALITPLAILTPSLVLPPSLLFDPRYFFVPEELLPPKKQIHPPSSSSTMLSNSSQKQVMYLY